MITIPPKLQIEKKRGGGVLIYAHRKTSFEIVNSLNHNKLQILTARVKLGSISILLSCIYLPPNSVKTETLDTLESYCDSLNFLPAETHIICGDFNVNFLKHSSKQKRINEIMTGCGLKLGNSYCPTRQTSTSGSCIDLFFSNEPCSVTVNKTDISDHFTVSLSLNSIVSYSTELPVHNRQWAKLSHPKVVESMKLFLRTSMNGNRKKRTIDAEISTLHEILINNLDENLPLRIVKPHKKPSWIDNEVKKEATRKAQFRKKYIETGCEEDKKTYKKQVQVVKRLVNKKKREFYHQRINTEGKSCSREFFNIYNEITGKVQKKATSNINVNNLESFNVFFATIGEQLNNNFKNIKEVPFNQNPNSMFFSKFSSTEILEVINNCKNKYSLDCFGLNYVYLKQIAEIISPKLAEIFNDCVDQGLFPDILKRAKVVPLHKEGDETDPSNFRPISLLPVLGKIFERLIYNRIVNFLDRFDLLNCNQFGFRRNIGTVDAIGTLVEGIREQMVDRSSSTFCTFIDLKKAFDTVDHQILLRKCFSKGLRGPVFDLLKSYLNNRTQFVEIGLKKSSDATIKTGVPQGSILGPLLFLLYISDFQVNDPNTNLILFADDTVVNTTNNVDSVNNSHQRALQESENWLIANKLTLNTKKTKCVVFGKSKKRIKPSVYLSKTEIEVKKSFRYLGIVVDNQLNFSEHVTQVTKKLTQFCGIFYRLRKALSSNQMVKAFKCYVKPVIQYGILVYGCASKTLMNKIDALCRRLLRIIFYKKKFESVQTEIDKHKLYSAKELHVYELFKCYLRILKQTIKNPVLQKTFTIDEIERLESGRNKSISCNKNRFAGNGIQIRIRKLANLIARADINVISEVKNISSKLQLNGYVHSFLDNFIFGNAALVDRIYC